MEPSPTTGSLPKLHQTVHSSMTSTASATFPVTTACFNTSTVDGKRSSFFEFRPHDRSNMVMILIDVSNTLMNTTFVLGGHELEFCVSSPVFYLI